MLVGKRIKLRAIEEEDIPKMVEWRNSPDVYEFFYEYEPLSKIKQKMWLEKHFADPTEKLFIISTLDGEAIGTVGFVHIDHRNRKAEWGRFLIGEEKYSKGGYGAEVEFLILEYAFEHLNLNKLYCEVLTNNPTVISLHKKFGFKEEGVFRQHIYKGSEYVDAVVMSLLREEYFAQKDRLLTLKKKLIGQ
jgi:UDP-4-amino-4,6-dideoxy-N-acetyl-beta-L-altrosamine N-acetyltransferase